VIDKRFWLIVPLNGEPVLIVDAVHEINARDTSCVEDVRIWGRRGGSCVDELVDVFRCLKLERATVGMELGLHSIIHMSPNEFDEIRNRLDKVSFVNVDELVGRARIVKSPLEIERLRRACEITCEGLKVGYESIREGMTEREVLNIIVGEWLRLGADTAYNSTNYGYQSLQADRVGQMTPSLVERRIQKGDLIQMDGGAVYRGYGADIYRNVVVGAKPPRRLQKYAEGCEYIHSQTLRAIAPGTTSAQICAVAEEATKEIGFERHRRILSDAVSAEKGSMIGHGLGFSVHEFPYICPSDETPWVEGMCGALEIAFGDSEVGYIEWEDDFLVTETGCEILTPLEKRLLVV
jgi:Xaa-Pro aminopeptidase